MAKFQWKFMYQWSTGETEYTCQVQSEGRTLTAIVGYLRDNGKYVILVGSETDIDNGWNLASEPHRLLDDAASELIRSGYTPA